MNDRVIQVRDLWKSYPGPHGGEEVHVLQHIDMEVVHGEFICLVGPSGCGKSTLLNIISGFLPRSRGEVLVEGGPLRGPDPRRILIFQEGTVFPWLTVEENIGFALSHKGPAERQRIVRHYIEMVGLSGFARAYPRALSGGMRQRVELDRALAADPEIIYMDEPFGALDFFTRFKMRADLIRIWQQERKTILFVTHDIEEAIQLADRVLVLGNRPATIKTVIEIDLPRPRDLKAAAYLHARDLLLDSLGMNVPRQEGLVSARCQGPPAAARQG